MDRPRIAPLGACKLRDHFLHTAAPVRQAQTAGIVQATRVQTRIAGSLRRVGASTVAIGSKARNALQHAGGECIVELERDVAPAGLAAALR